MPLGTLLSTIVRMIPGRYLGGLAYLMENAQSEWLHSKYRDQYDVSPSFRFVGPGIKLYGPGEIRLGPDSYIGRYANLKAVEGQKIVVGENTAISHFVFMYTANRVADQDLSETKEHRQGDVVIGDHCWIGAFTFIAEGNTIGDHAVVGAHSVVTRDLPPHSISAGSPARVIEFKSELSAPEQQRLAEEYSSSLSGELREELVDAD